MKPASHDSTPKLRPASRRRGFALVLVISMLALLMVLMTAFLSLGQDESRLSHMHMENSRANCVAQSAVSTSLAQLRTATSQTFENGAPKPWTSQPGGIRVHRMNGTLETLYKLYSAPSLTADSPAETAVDLPGDWQAHPARFVDLNAPRPLSGGGLRFPVVDPRAKTTNSQTRVEGFDYQEVAGAVGPGEDESAQRLPMPVQWIYQLRDGQMGTLNAQGKLVLPNPESKPTAENPIVARFAFWVDDETSKINVNTAAEGSFWDSPRADNAQERLLATTVPSRLEYARHPGHPAGVCLSSVLLPGRRLYPAGFPVLDSAMQTMTVQDALDLWRMGRLVSVEENAGTSFGGTREAEWTTLWPAAPAPRPRQARYAATHEVLFDQSPAAGQNLQATSTGGSSAGERRSVSGFFSRHPDALERLRRGGFFLTASSSAPEVTLYGTPRVATWPAHAQTLDNEGNIDQDPRRDTVHNHKVKLAAMLKGQPWFVVRSEPGNGMNDFDRHGRGANRRLYDHLQRITSKPIPGFQRSGFSTFEAKYGEDRDSILLGIMDYIRASNFADGQLAGTMQFSILCPGVEHHGFGQVSPLQFRVRNSEMGTSNHARGLGRTPAISEVALVISCRAEVVEGPDGNPEIQGQPTDAGRSQLTEIGDRELEAGFMVELFVPGHGWTDYCPFITAGMFGGLPGAEPRGSDAFPALTLNGQPLVPYGTGGNKPRNRLSSAEFPPAGWHGAGGSIGLRALSEGALVFRPVVVKAGTDGTLPHLRLSGSAGQAEQIKIALYDVPESTDKADLLQVVPLVIPDIGLEEDPEAPRLDLPRLSAELTDPLLENRLHLASLRRQPLLTESDVVQSFAPLHGDYRLTAAQRWVESRGSAGASPLFTPHPLWGQQRHAHDLRDSFLPVISSAAGYIPGLDLPPGTGPDIPAALSQPGASVRAWRGSGWETGTVASVLNNLRLDGGLRGDALPWITGDFDNGYASSPDGPYMNRPDDGHWAAATRTGTTPYFDNISQTGPRVPPVSPAAFSPQRLMPSPVMFGSLPTGVRAQVPWQTLLFRPQPGHYGAESPPDHLLLDLFWTPVLEPEPLSHHFETAGKINLNHELLPFRHITRATALHAAMKAETLMAIPDDAASAYKSGADPAQKYRRHIDAGKTLALWKENVFDQGQVFLTASQICEQHLVPEGFSGSVSDAEMRAYWSRHRLTGDNTRERPYAHLYSRLTTRSNSYRVHFIAETIVKARSTAPDTFDPARDRVTATRQGSAHLRRRLHLDHPALPDYLTQDDAPALDHFYHWQAGPLDWE